MKHVLVLGAGGVLGSEITRQLEQYSEVEQTCYDIRHIVYHRINGRNIQADVCDKAALYEAVKEQDYVVCSLNGDWFTQAHSRYVSRTAVAMLICKIILSEDHYGMNESIGITD